MYLRFFEQKPMKTVFFPQPYPRLQNFPGVCFHYDINFSVERKLLTLLVGNNEAATLKCHKAT